MAQDNQPTQTTSTAAAATPLAAQPTPSPATEAAAYQVVVKAPPAGGMLAYLVGPGAQIQLVGIDLNSATLAQEAGNLRITLANGAEVLLLDYVNSAQDAKTVVITESGTLPAQQLLLALDETKVAAIVAEVEPAAGPTVAGGQGGLNPPTILGTGVGNGEGIFSSVIDPFAIPRPADNIQTQEFPFEPSVEILPPPPPFNNVVAVDDVVTMPKDINSILIDAKANDFDPQNDAFSITRIVSVSAGTATLENGQIRYTNPTAAQTTATIVYEVTDAKGATDTATITVNIEADTVQTTQQPPVARDDAFSTAEDVPVTLTPAQLLVNDSDPEGDPLTIISVQGAENGTVSMVGGNIVFTPKQGFTGTGSFSYTITDGNGGTSTADVTIQIDPDPATENNVIAADDAETVNSGASVRVNVLSNDSDPEGDALVPGSVRIISGPDRGSVTVNADGSVTYQAVATDSGYFTSFIYEVADARGARDTATVTIEVLSAANSVDAIDDTGFVQPAGAVKSFNVVANDVDPQGDSFQITSISQPRLGNGTVVGSASFDPATGVITYNSAASASGYTVNIDYTITDARGATDTATLTINVQPGEVNSVEAVDDTADMLAGQAVNINVLENDVDPQGDTFRITRITSQPVDGNGAARGSVTVNNDGTITFTDSANARNSGVVEFAYEIVDSKGALDTAVVRVTIGTAPNGVDANNDTLTIAEDAPRTDITDRILANDFDPQNDDFSITAIGTIPASQGTLELVNGRVFFTPAADFNGPVTFTYTITDEFGATDTAQVYINVNEMPDGLVAGNDNFSTDFNTPITITAPQVLANDYDPDGTVLTRDNIISFTQPGSGTVTRDANGNFVFTPAPGFSGTTSFNYTIQDDQNEVDTATVTIRVNEPEQLDNPVDAVNDLLVVAPGDTKQINVLANDSAPDGGLQFVRVVGTLPAGVENLGNGLFRYTAPDDRTDFELTFQYEARDVDGDTDIATVVIRVTGDVNSVDARDDVVTMAQDVNSILIDAKANDVDPQGDAFSITRIVSVSEGTATIENGQIRYTNPTRDAGTATIVYEITDARGATDTATITVNIVADSNSVDARDDVVTMAQDVNSILIDAKANDVDPQGDAFSITRIVSVSEGTATIENGQIRYTNPTRDAGTATIVYEITDARGATDTATITVNIVADTNDVIARDDSYTVNEFSRTRLNVLANDSDPQGDDFEITRIVSGPSIGSASITSDGRISYRSTSGSYTTTLVYEIRDENGATDTATVTIRVVGTPTDTNIPNSGGQGDGGAGDCPLTIDLNGDGISIMMQAESTAHFDLNGDGVAEWTAWVNGADDAILAIDRNSNGSIDNINEVFGGRNMDGFTELAMLEDTNDDGVVDANDANWSQLRLWLDANHDGVTDEGELHSLDSFGITAINLGTTDVSIQYGDAYINKTGTVTLDDGSTLNAGSVFYTNTSNGNLLGSSASDVLIYSAAADSIDGGQGADTLKVLTASDIVISHDAVRGVEGIDLANNGTDKLELNINDVLNISDTGILTIEGDAVDEVTLTGDAVRGDDVTQGGHTYASYTGGNGGTVLVELGLTVHNSDQ